LKYKIVHNNHSLSNDTTIVDINNQTNMISVESKLIPSFKDNLNNCILGIIGVRSKKMKIQVRDIHFNFLRGVLLNICINEINIEVKKVIPCTGTIRLMFVDHLLENVIKNIKH